MPCILTGAGLLFCQNATQPNTSVYSAFRRVNAIYYRPRHKTAHRALQRCFLRFRLFNRPRYQTDKSGYNTTCATLDGLPAPGRPQPIPDTTATLGRCTGQHRPPIIIMYIRGCIRLRTMPAAAGQQSGRAVWHPPPGGAVQRRAARNHWRLAPHLFSGCRPIANRGQQ